MAKIYVASSWRNPFQQEVVNILRDLGHEVYDFKNPHMGMVVSNGLIYIIRKSKFPQNPKRSVRFSGKGTKRSVQKRKARNTQKAETKVL